jgi:hypothetical protein
MDRSIDDVIGDVVHDRVVDGILHRGAIFGVNPLVESVDRHPPLRRQKKVLPDLLVPNQLIER